MFTNLLVWQKAMLLVTDVYAITATFPKEEIYGLVSQLRRAVVSIPSNIAEGQGRRFQAEVTQFLTHERGSIQEVQTQIMTAEMLEFISQSAADELLSLTYEVSRMINGLLSAQSKLREKA
jgi:four helix bundle protein